MRLTLILFCVITFLAGSKSEAKTFYISEIGKMDNDGSRNNPFPFKYLESRRYHGGDTFIVLSGKYLGHWVTNIYGKENHPVKIQSESWMAAEIMGVEEERNGSRLILDIKGPYSWFIGFEIHDEDTQYRIVNNGDKVTISNGVYLNAPGGKVINCVAHDVLIGFSTWAPAIEGEIYGCIAYNIGWNNHNSKRNSKGHGHGYYLQNKEGEVSQKRLKMNIVWGTASYGFHAYTQSGSIENFCFENNLAYNMIGYNQIQLPGPGFLVGGYQPVSGLMFNNNHMYNTSFQLGYGANYPILSKNVQIDNNYFINCDIILYHLQDLKSFSNNFIIPKQNVLIAVESEKNKNELWQWPFENNSIYVTPERKSVRLGMQELGKGGTQYVEMSESRWNTKNQIHRDSPGNKTFFYENQYNPEMAYIYVYNHAGNDNVPLKADHFLEIGDDYELRDVENLQKVLHKGKYDGKIQLPMRLTELAAISGNLPSAHARHSDHYFNAFILRKVTSEAK